MTIPPNTLKDLFKSAYFHMESIDLLVKEIVMWRETFLSGVPDLRETDKMRFMNLHTSEMMKQSPSDLIAKLKSTPEEENKEKTVAP